MYVFIYKYIYGEEAPGIFLELLRFVQMLKRDWGAESNGKVSHLFIPGKTAALIPEFAMEDLPVEHSDYIYIVLDDI